MNKGFSLVELIVVIAIMAILVGVAVPVYTQYISSANENVDKQYADELERAVDTLVIDIKAGLSTENKTIKLDGGDGIGDIKYVTWTSEGVKITDASDVELTDANAAAFKAALTKLIDTTVLPKSATVTAKIVVG